MDNEKKHTLEIAALVVDWLNRASGKHRAYNDVLAFLEHVKADDIGAINEALSHSPMQRIATGHHTFSWFPAPGRANQLRELSKAHMLQALCDLAERGALESLRQCQTDGRWFVGLRSNQAHCSVACRRKHQASGEAFKAHRRDYMRKYYALQQKGVTK